MTASWKHAFTAITLVVGVVLAGCTAPSEGANPVPTVREWARAMEVTAFASAALHVDASEVAVATLKNPGTVRLARFTHGGDLLSHTWLNVSGVTQWPETHPTLHRFANGSYLVVATAVGAPPPPDSDLAETRFLVAHFSGEGTPQGAIRSPDTFLSPAYRYPWNGVSVAPGDGTLLVLTGAPLSERTDPDRGIAVAVGYDVATRTFGSIQQHKIGIPLVAEALSNGTVHLRLGRWAPEAPGAQAFLTRAGDLLGLEPWTPTHERVYLYRASPSLSGTKVAALANVEHSGGVYLFVPDRPGHLGLGPGAHPGSPLRWGSTGVALLSPLLNETHLPSGLTLRLWTPSGNLTGERTLAQGFPLPMRDLDLQEGPEGTWYALALGPGRTPEDPTAVLTVVTQELLLLRLDPAT